MAFINFQPKDYFNTKLYTGNGSTQSITGVGFQPDWLWIKNRDGANNHILQDAVRGATKSLESDGTGAETTSSTRVTSFDSDGFSIGSAGTNNTNTNNYVSWNWKTNGSGSSNTDGSITSTVSASTTSGFSIVKWNGQTGTVGHGLGAKPAFIVVKCLGITNSWVGTHQGLGTNMSDNYIILNSTGASGSTSWGGEPTSSVFSINSNVAENNDNIAYCFAEKKGFSKFGSYIGNGSTDGPMIYTGFKPAFIIAKTYGSTGNWILWDNKRDGYNETLKRVYPNLSTAEESSTAYGVDILSNGFKLRGTASNLWNSGNSTYIYMAFAEEPLVSSNGVPNTAR